MLLKLQIILCCILALVHVCIFCCACMHFACLITAFVFCILWIYFVFMWRRNEWIINPTWVQIHIVKLDSFFYKYWQYNKKMYSTNLHVSFNLPKHIFVWHVRCILLELSAWLLVKRKVLLQFIKTHFGQLCIFLRNIVIWRSKSKQYMQRLVFITRTFTHPIYKVTVFLKNYKI